MSTELPPPSLPPDILLHITDSLIQHEILSPIAYPPSHPITQTLVSLTRTCRVTYPLALRLLYAKCLYIDTPKRLQSLLDTLTNLSASATGTVVTRSRTLPHVSLLHHITSLYLSPYPQLVIIDLPTTKSIHSVLSILAPALRRLVLNIPLRSLDHSEYEMNLGPILRQAFSQLVALEVFCSVRDELYLDYVSPPSHADDPYVWSLWPKIKTLALYNTDVSSNQFWKELAKLRRLETLVLTRSDGLEEKDLKREWRRCCGSEERESNVFLVNVQSEHTVLMGKEFWKEDDKVVVTEVNVPTSYYGDDDRIKLCQEWVELRTLNGEIGSGLKWWD